MKRSGFFEYWLQISVGKKDFEIWSHENKFQAINLHNLIGIYMILFCGLFTSGLCLMLEIFKPDIKKIFSFVNKLLVDINYLINLLREIIFICILK